MHDHIFADSPRSAETVINEIAATAGRLSVNALIFPPDKYKTDNDGSYRAFEKQRCRIAYRTEDNVVRILSVRHTKSIPQKY